MEQGRRPFRFATDAFGVAQSASEVTAKARQVEARGYAFEPLAQYGVTYQSDQRRLGAVTEEQRFVQAART